MMKKLFLFFCILTLILIGAQADDQRTVDATVTVSWPALEITLGNLTADFTEPGMTEEAVTDEDAGRYSRLVICQAGDPMNTVVLRIYTPDDLLTRDYDSSTRPVSDYIRLAFEPGGDFPVLENAGAPQYVTIAGLSSAPWTGGLKTGNSSFNFKRKTGVPALDAGSHTCTIIFALEIQ